MEFEYCKDCNFLGRPCSFTGRNKGILQYNYDNDPEFCSCCHPIFNGGVQLAGLTECPKTKNLKEKYETI